VVIFSLGVYVFVAYFINGWAQERKAKHLVAPLCRAIYSALTLCTVLYLADKGHYTKDSTHLAVFVVGFSFTLLDLVTNFASNSQAKSFRLVIEAVALGSLVFPPHSQPAALSVFAFYGALLLTTADLFNSIYFITGSSVAGYIGFLSLFIGAPFTGYVLYGDAKNFDSAVKVMTVTIINAFLTVIDVQCHASVA